MGHECFGDRIGLRKKAQDALQVELGEFPIAAPLQTGGVRLAVAATIGFGVEEPGVGHEVGHEGGALNWTVERT
jgi:hypothetical protein